MAELLAIGQCEPSDKKLILELVQIVIHKRNNR